MKRRIQLSVELENLVRRGKADTETVEKLLEDRLQQIVEEMKNEGQT